MGNVECPMHTLLRRPKLAYNASELAAEGIGTVMDQTA
jgi:hypothetical protein